MYLFFLLGEITILLAIQKNKREDINLYKQYNTVLHLCWLEINIQYKSRDNYNSWTAFAVLFLMFSWMQIICIEVISCKFCENLIGFWSEQTCSVFPQYFYCLKSRLLWFSLSADSSEKVKIILGVGKKNIKNHN